MKSRAFTLIELLVVVLIIGILSAIALPQYQKAVLKARATELLIIGRSIQRAQQVYKLANGNYTSDLEELDVQVPCSFQEYTGTNENVSSMIFCPHIEGFLYAHQASLYLTGFGDFWINFNYNDENTALCSEGADTSVQGLCATLGATYNYTDSKGRKRYDL